MNWEAAAAFGPAPDPERDLSQTFQKYKHKKVLTDYVETNISCDENGPKSNLLSKEDIHTTTLPFSKVVVYLRVQKSRAGAKVVGAYV